MIHYFEKDESISFYVLPPLYLPFYNKWGRNEYYTYQPFDFDPFNIDAISTSGSPVVLNGNMFFGFLNENGGRFSYDGAGNFTVTGVKGQALWYSTDCAPFTEWEAYNKYVLKDMPQTKPQKFWGGLEYCTWVDQKNRAQRDNCADVWQPLTEKYVYEYAQRIKKLGLPKGKLTIDDGWAVRKNQSGKTQGDWQVDKTKFPNLPQLVKDLTAEGFIPGLWFAPVTFTPNSTLGRSHPEIIGLPWNQAAEEEESQKLMYMKPSPLLQDYYDQVFGYYADMGFKKFKLDMTYGKKREMKEMLKMIYFAIKKADNTIEAEIHIPDIFISRYADTVRINDVAFDDSGAWRAVTFEHYKVAKYSSADKILNLDHIGTNTPCPSEENYLMHLRLLTRLKGGYPCASLLPDVFSQSAQDEYVATLNAWVNNK